MNSRWQANRIGLINFWYYDEQEFPFIKGRMLLRGSNGSGKSVTMQSVVPLLLDGNMSPERLDPFGSRDRKMVSYLLEEDDGREERTGYLYLEFKREKSDTYLTVGMGIRARRGKNLDKWYFSLTDGRRVGRDFYLYRETGEKVTLSKKELENRIGDGGRVFDRQAEYMEYVNNRIFGFGTEEEYKEMIDLLIQLRTPKLSKDFKPSVINDILSDSLQPLSDDDLRPMSEAIENMDTMTMNLKSRREAKQAAEKIQEVYAKYNRKLLYEKADRYKQARTVLENAKADEREYENRLKECRQKISEFKKEHQMLDARRESLEKERESLNRSDAVGLKQREIELAEELKKLNRNLLEKQDFSDSKQEQIDETLRQIAAEEERTAEKAKELEEMMNRMQEDADAMAFEEHTFMKAELEEKMDEPYKFELHQQLFDRTKEKISECTEILAETEQYDRQKDEYIKERDRCIHEQDTSERRIHELESVFVEAQNEWKESLNRWNASNRELVLEKETLRDFIGFADTYGEVYDFAHVNQIVAGIWSVKNAEIEMSAAENRAEIDKARNEYFEVNAELDEWENMKEPQPVRSEAVVRNRQRLDEMKIPYQEFYRAVEFGTDIDENACSLLEEALDRMGILDALVIDEQYKDKVLRQKTGCEDRYLFTGPASSGKSLLDILQLNEEVNDLLSNHRLTGVLGSIAYDGDGIVSVSEDGTYRMGVLAGTVTGEYEASFIGTKARERLRIAKIEECRQKLEEIGHTVMVLEEAQRELEGRKARLKNEYESFPGDSDMKAALQMLHDEERNYGLLKQEGERLEELIRAIAEAVKEKKKKALEISGELYLVCSYEVFRQAEAAAEEYGRYMVGLKASHEMYLRSTEYLHERRRRLEDINEDMVKIRNDLAEITGDIRKREEEQSSVKEQLRLTNYEEIKERLDYCITWLHEYPERLHECASRQAHEEDEALQLDAELDVTRKKIEEYIKKSEYYLNCYEMEQNLNYVSLPETAVNDAYRVHAYLEDDAENTDRESIIRDLNKVYFENRGFLTDYQLTQTELFAVEERMERPDGFSPKRLDISARYQGVKVSFTSLLMHLEEDIHELENLIKDGDRELFEDILANTVSRKIRGKINASNMWVQKMNALMNGMNTSSGLKLSLRWRSKTAEEEDQLDTRELVDLLKKDYRLMSEEEASRLSAHFRSKVAQARRNAQDSAGMISFYQIMKDTLDYRKWFEFQLFSQKSGERQKELTNSVFGTFSGGEKAMSMYVPLFSAVVAKYQGGREDAPRLISLDEAFAGVDNRNIRDMFRLMTEFQFNFIINSQVLWGDCDTLDALAIYQLIRPENAKFVTVMPYLWNGRKKELLEHETEVEHRSAEIEQNK